MGLPRSIRIDRTAVSEVPWERVDKLHLEAFLFHARKQGVRGATAAIRECFAYVPDLERRSTWGGPHHVLRDGDRVLVLSLPGLRSLAGALAGSRGGVGWPKAARVAAIRHALRHYQALAAEPPPSLR